MKRSHKTQLYPNNKQSTLLHKTCGCNRYAHKWLLNQTGEDYKNGIKFNKFSLKRAFNQFKKTLPWMREVNAHTVVNDAIDRLDKGFKNFFAGRAKYPAFHKKKHKVGSFSLPDSEIKYDADNKRIHIPRLGWIKLAEPISFEYSTLYRITVSNQTGKWYVSFSLEVSDSYLCENQTRIGIDRGLKDMAILSDGSDPVKNIRVSSTYAVRLRKLNKELSRRNKGGRNWRKTVYRLRSLYARVTNIRQDYIHKFTTCVCRRYEIICLEDLNVAGMLKNHKLARAISDVSWSGIKRQFEYKAFEVQYCGRFEPTTQRCNVCHHVNETKLTLADRTFVCGQCSHTEDRDVNAAKNIRTFAVSSTGSKKSVVKKPLAVPFGTAKVSHGQKENSLSILG